MIQKDDHIDACYEPYQKDGIGEEYRRAEWIELIGDLSKKVGDMDLMTRFEDLLSERMNHINHQHYNEGLQQAEQRWIDYRAAHQHCIEVMRGLHESISIGVGAIEKLRDSMCQGLCDLSATSAVFRSKPTD